LLEELTPLSKLLGSFLKTWRDRKSARTLHTQFASTSVSVEQVKDRVGLALSLLRRVSTVGKMKKILNIEAGLEMIALGMVICSEVCFFLPAFIEHILRCFSSIRIMGCFQNMQRTLKRC
jgi:hypothetical protein